MTECLFELCPCPQFKSQEDHKAVEIELRVRATTRAQEAGIFTTNPHTGFEVSSSLSLSLSPSLSQLSVPPAPATQLSDLRARIKFIRRPRAQMSQLKSESGTNLSENRDWALISKPNSPHSCPSHRRAL